MNDTMLRFIHELLGELLDTRDRLYALGAQHASDSDDIAKLTMECHRLRDELDRSESTFQAGVRRNTAGQRTGPVEDPAR